MPIEENQPDESAAQVLGFMQAPKPRRALSRLKRELSDEELGSTGVQKLLLDSLEQAREENSELKSFRDKFYECDKQVGVLKEKFKTDVAVEVVSIGSLAIGAAAIVYAPVAWAHQPDGWIALGFGIVLTIVGIVAKVIRP